MRSAALILSSDPLGAALLGAALHAIGTDPDFPRAGESARDAVRRLRPSVALVDAGRDASETAGFAGPARMMGAHVLLYAGVGHERALREAATHLSASAFVLPGELRALVDCVQELLHGEQEAG